jgi:hypothetical protein
MSNLFRTNVIEITNILFIIKYLYHPNLYMKIGEQNLFQSCRVAVLINYQFNY